MTDSTYNTIRQGAVLAALTISKWGNSKQDKRASAKLAREMGAKLGEVRAQKSLLSDDFVKPLNTLLNKARADFHAATLPWTDNGWRLLPVGKLTSINEAIADAQQSLNDLLRETLRDYAYEVQRRQSDLGAAFNPADYPSTAEIQSKYRIKIGMMPVPSDDDFRLAVAGDVADAIRDQAREQYTESARRAVQSVWASVGELLTLVHERLLSSDGRFTSIFPKLIDLIDGLDVLNITNDPELSRLKTEASKRLTILRDPQSIKKDDAGRKQAAADVQSVIDDFAGMWG